MAVAAFTVAAAPLPSCGPSGVAAGGRVVGALTVFFVLVRRPRGWSGRDVPMLGNKKPPPAQLHEGCALVEDRLRC